MSDLESLNMNANDWRFLRSAEEYVEASNRRLQASSRCLQATSTERQFATARKILERLNGTHGQRPQKGVLLADDVGLGKTTVAALIAWTVAARKNNLSKVRILVPNDVMRGRWEQEIKDHVELLKKCANNLDVNERRVKSRRGERLAPGSIQIVKHSYAVSTKKKLTCDLLIVDEAHRAKGQDSKFSKALRKHAKGAKRVLVLTATPFSIHIKELIRLISLIGGDDQVKEPVKEFSDEIEKFYQRNSVSDIDATATGISDNAKKAIDALCSCVIRHGIDDLPKEKKVFGKSSEWSISVPKATDEEMELMLRMDRTLHLSDASGSRTDPRFHVGWSHFDDVLEAIEIEKVQSPPCEKVVRTHHSTMKMLRRKVGRDHPKMVAVGNAVKELITAGEKCVLFCKHHATARELAVYLDSSNMPRARNGMPSRQKWNDAWNWVLHSRHQDPAYMNARKTFIDWLCSAPVRAQTWRWISHHAKPGTDLDDLFREHSVRGVARAGKIADEANRLFRELWNNKSSRGVLRNAGIVGSLEGIPGATGKGIVLGICHEATAVAAKEMAKGGLETERPGCLLNPNQRPDMALAFFNSPFGPDVLVVTDKLSEGVDLHRYCRHLIHYELNPSPISTIQRNGRIRRVDSWASVTNKEIMYSYPSFYGTRDHRLVQIVKKRINSFSLLLGGVKDFDDSELIDDVERWRNEVLVEVKKQMKDYSGRLCVGNAKSS